MGAASNRLAVSVRIAGHDYKIRGDGDEEGLIRIAGYVDRAMERVRARTGTVDSLDVAVLTCLNLAREILAAREQRSGEADDEGRIRTLIERVEAALDRRALEAEKNLDDRNAGDPRKAALGHEANEPAGAEAAGRTLELSSVEELRDRRSSTPIESSGADLNTPARAAAGGRDRVG
ncbi:MAG: cell division protein ZapA [Myxococcota bacterium]